MLTRARRDARSYTLLIVFGHLRDWLLNAGGAYRFDKEDRKMGMSPLLGDWETFYTHNLYKRIEVRTRMRASAKRSRRGNHGT